jgi:hypothetical protein
VDKIKTLSIKQSFGLIWLFWTLFIILNAITDSMIFHRGMFWYWEMGWWHGLKPFWIFFNGMAFWYGRELIEAIYENYYNYHKTRFWLSIIFFIVWFCLWRWGLFDWLMDLFAKRIIL